jgi:CubicO group peptidase (beta-lactamase class C family)
MKTIHLVQKLERLQYLKPSAEFRETLQYTNIMYAVLSYLPTALLPDKPSFARYVKEHIIDPLGMNSTTYSFIEANTTGRLADGFGRDRLNVTVDPFGPGIPRVMPYYDFNMVGEDGDSER